MLTYRKYKQMSYDTSLFGYIYYIINPIIVRLKCPYHIYMCIKYPFLYPRNRHTDLHYTNQTIIDFLNLLNRKYRKYAYVYSKDELSKLTINQSYVKKIKGNFVEYWANFWAKPFYYTVKFFHDVILQIFFCIPISNEFDMLPIGWKKAFGKELLRELKYQLKEENLLYKYRIKSIQNRNGYLVINSIIQTNGIHEILSKYYFLSKNICIECGKKAEVYTNINCNPFCMSCAKKNNLQYTT